MRVSISGEKALIEALEVEFERDQACKVEQVKVGGDQTELAFGIGELATMIGILTGAAKLVEVLLALRPKLSSSKQNLYLKTVLGTTIVELSKDITAEELYQQLGTILGGA
jgi:hypothetical protein